MKLKEKDFILLEKLLRKNASSIQGFPWSEEAGVLLRLNKLRENGRREEGNRTTNSTKKSNCS